MKLILLPLACASLLTPRNLSLVSLSDDHKDPNDCVKTVKERYCENTSTIEECVVHVNMCEMNGHNALKKPKPPSVPIEEPK